MLERDLTTKLRSSHRISISKGAEDLLLRRLCAMMRTIEKGEQAGPVEYYQAEERTPGHLSSPQPATESRSGSRLVREPTPSSSFISHVLFSGKLIKQHEPTGESAEAECEMLDCPCYPNGVQFDLSADLSPASIPDNPVATTDASHIAKELAWLSAETSLMLASPNDDDDIVPLALPFAWAHGSLHMRKLIATLFPHQTMDCLDVTRSGEHVGTEAISSRDMIVVDGRKLLLDDASSESINQLRAEALAGMRLGFFRKESVKETIERSVSSRQGGIGESCKSIAVPVVYLLH